MRLHRGMPVMQGSDMRDAQGRSSAMMQQGMMGGGMNSAVRRGSASKDADLVRSSSRHTKKWRHHPYVDTILWRHVVFLQKKNSQSHTCLHWWRNVDPTVILTLETLISSQRWCRRPRPSQNLTHRKNQSKYEVHYCIIMYCKLINKRL